MNILTQELGYSTSWAILDSRHFGTAQKRRRVYIVGFDAGLGGQFHFPSPESHPSSAHSIRFGDIRQKEGVDRHHYLSRKYLSGLYKHRAKQKSLGRNFGYLLVGDDNLANALLCNKMGWERNLVSDIPGVSLADNLGELEGKVRFMTPLEWERLQSFPDGWTEGESDTIRRRLLGNAVTVNVVKAVCGGIVGELVTPSPVDKGLFG